MFLNIANIMYTTCLDYHVDPVHVVSPGNCTAYPWVKTTLTTLSGQFQNIIVKL